MNTMDPMPEESVSEINSIRAGSYLGNKTSKGPDKFDEWNQEESVKSVTDKSGLGSKRNSGKPTSMAG